MYDGVDNSQLREMNRNLQAINEQFRKLNNTLNTFLMVYEQNLNNIEDTRSCKDIE